MVIPVQKTKLFIPQARVKLVDRPHLLERLDRLKADGCRAALISAPAGSGKTTLTVQWLVRSGWPAGWVSLDARDNLPSRFFSYLMAALPEQEAMTAVSKEVLALLDLPGAHMEEVITLLTNGLVESAIPKESPLLAGSLPSLPARPFVLVLDDLHTITNPLLHQALDLLIEAQPPQMRLVLLSREDPTLHLARRRARGQLVELRQEDLRFTLDEAVAFLNQSMDLDLTTMQVEILEARTEGWIAGLQMAALALQMPLAFDQPDNVERFLQDFSGSHRFILDYLMEEVLARQPAEVENFLSETGILERMCAELCAAVTGKTVSEAQRLLEHLTKANLFVIPLDEERRWYRYHHLFQDLLLSRLQSITPARAAVLERRASDWYEANGDPRLAVEYALKAADFQHAADLIDRHITERWQTVDMEFHLLINRLPFEVITERPSLCLQSAWLCVMFGQIDRILPFVEAAEKALNESSSLGEAEHNADASRSAASRAFARTLRMYLKDLDNQPVELDESLGLAYAAIPEENPGMRNSVAVIIGTIYFMEGDFAAALYFFEDALALDQRVNGTNAVPITTMRIAFVLQTQGRLHEAVRRLRQSEVYIRERGSRRFYISGAINLLLGDIYLEWNRLDEAEAQIREGLRLLGDWPIPAIHGLGQSLLARVYLARGNLADARAAFERADALRQKSRFHPFFLDAIERARVRLLIAEQNWAALETWAQSNGMAANRVRSGMALPFRYEHRLIDLCRAWLALGRQDEAAKLLAAMTDTAQGRTGSLILILALRAAADSRRPAAAFSALEEALRLAEPEGYLRTFVDMGEPLRQVLNSWLRRQPSTGDPRLREYAQRLLSAFAVPSLPDGKAETPQNAFPEALSLREKEVLLLIAKGLTNQQIADRLVISIRTVKKHVENIHGKLGALNRTQAVIKAQEFGLLNKP